MTFVREGGVTRFLSRDDDDDDDYDDNVTASLNLLKPKVKVKLNNSSTPGETIQQINVLLCSLSCGMTLDPWFILH